MPATWDLAVRLPREKGFSSMFLHTLLRQISSPVSLAGIPDVEITGVCEDSRKVGPGSLFVARSGTRADGAHFLLDAEARGAAAAIVQRAVPDITLPQIVVRDSGAAASVLAHR